jgi:hypothetical protein
MMIGVERDQVTLYVDCQPVDKKPIKGKGPVNTEGDTLIGRLDVDADASVVVSGAGIAWSQIGLCCIANSCGHCLG